jgi:hypothetical protein
VEMEPRDFGFMAHTWFLLSCLLSEMAYMPAYCGTYWVHVFNAAFSLI